MAGIRPGASGLNCRQCGVYLHSEWEVVRGLCEQCADIQSRERGDNWSAGRRWVHRLWSDIQAVPEDVAREGLFAPKEDMPAEVARAIESLLRWHLDNPPNQDTHL